MRRLYRAHWLIGYPILRVLCFAKGHDCFCPDVCCEDDDGRHYCHRCLRWV